MKTCSLFIVIRFILTEKTDWFRQIRLMAHCLRPRREHPQPMELSHRTGTFHSCQTWLLHETQGQKRRAARQRTRTRPIDDFRRERISRVEKKDSGHCLGHLQQGREWRGCGREGDIENSEHSSWFEERYQENHAVRCWPQGEYLYTFYSNFYTSFFIKWIRNNQIDTKMIHGHHSI